MSKSAIGLLGALTLVAASVVGEQPPKELVSYIQDAKKLGLSDEQIRRNTAAAGWNARLVEDAFSTLIVRSSPSADNPRSAGADLPNNYRIGAGDVLQISVWKDPDASVPAATVRADGKISVPLIKEIDVVGLTPTELEKVLAQRLSRFIHGADVTVIVREIHSQRVFLVGAVKAVGAVELKGGGVTVLQALTQAGGVTDYAKRKQIYVLRTENGRQMKLPFNYDAVIRGDNMEQNIILVSNDTIVVPQ